MLNQVSVNLQEKQPEDFGCVFFCACVISLLNAIFELRMWGNLHHCQLTCHKLTSVTTLCFCRLFYKSMTVAFCLVWWRTLVFCFSCSFFCTADILEHLFLLVHNIYIDWVNICILSVVNKHSCITLAIMNPVIKTETRVFQFNFNSILI